MTTSTCLSFFWGRAHISVGLGAHRSDWPTADQTELAGHGKSLHVALCWTTLPGIRTVLLWTWDIREPKRHFFRMALRDQARITPPSKASLFGQVSVVRASPACIRSVNPTNKIKTTSPKLSYSDTGNCLELTLNGEQGGVVKKFFPKLHVVLAGDSIPELVC